jgi:hypothetical protein
MKTKLDMGGVCGERFEGLEYRKELALDRREWKLPIQVSEPWSPVPPLLLPFYVSFFICPFVFQFFYCFSPFFV